jgi:D-alanyl-D-alanine carboxypeptidase
MPSTLEADCRAVSSDDRARRLRAILERLVGRRGISHATLRVESGDGGLVWVGAEGEARPDGAPMHENTPFNIASIDKLFTAAAVLKLFERGKVDLDAPFSEILPDLRTGLHRMDGVDLTAGVTVRHLVGHTSGLADCLEDRPRGGKSVMERLFEGEDADWTYEDLLAPVRHGLAPHFPPQSYDAPRQRIRYSDTNFLLLQMILEAVESEPLHRIFKQMFFDPLALRHTWVYGWSEPADDPGPEAIIRIGPDALDRPGAIRSLRCLYSTTSDLVRFLRALMAGELHDHRVTVDLMRTDWNRFRVPRDTVSLRQPSWPIEYALGMMRFQLPRFATPFRPVPPVIGHSGSTGTWLFHAPDADLYLAGTVDQATAGAVTYRVVPQVLRVI